MRENGRTIFLRVSENKNGEIDVIMKGSLSKGKSMGMENIMNKIILLFKAI